MYHFFILGQVPGTNIIISFSMWMLLAAAVLSLLLWVRLKRRSTEPFTLEPTIGSDDGFFQSSIAR